MAWRRARHGAAKTPRRDTCGSASCPISRPRSRGSPRLYKIWAAVASLKQTPRTLRIHYVIYDFIPNGLAGHEWLTEVSMRVLPVRKYLHWFEFENYEITFSLRFRILRTATTVALTPSIRAFLIFGGSHIDFSNTNPSSLNFLNIL